MMTHPKFGPVLIEVNPRPSGSIGALTVAGIPFLEEVLLKLIGKKLNLDFNFIKNEVRVLSFLEGKVL